MSDGVNVVYNNSIKSQPAEKEPSDDLLKQTKRQADELIEITRNNIGLAMDRGEKISDLNEKSKSLVLGAGQFLTQTELFKRKEWIKRVKRKVAVFSFLAILLLLVILLIIQKSSN